MDTYKPLPYQGSQQVNYNSLPQVGTLLDTHLWIHHTAELSSKILSE